MPSPSSTFAAAMFATFGVTAQQSDAQLASQSGAGVHAVLTGDAAPAYLKLTGPEPGAAALAAARRELTFYREVAGGAPVRSPRLLGFAETADGIGLLLATAGVLVPAEQWTPPMWAELGAALGALHRMPIPSSADLRRPDWLLDALAAPDRPAIERFWGPAGSGPAGLLERRDGLAARLRATAPVFVHGDCHTDNIAHDGSSPVLLDWQSCGAGRPAADLALLSVRATPAGVTVPAELFEAYLAARTVDRAGLEAELAVEELAVLVFLWPQFAAYNSASGNERIRQRGLALHRHPAVQEVLT